MSLFTVEQYDKAIEALTLAKQQLVEGTQGNGCAVCGGCCHPDQCGWNPLYAQYLVASISEQSGELHETLHSLCGVYTYMGEPTGAARVRKP